MINGFMLDSARCLESRAYYHRFIDFIADRRMNTLLWHFSDDQGCSLRLDALPGAASPNAYDKAEMRQLIEYARAREITLIPELASLGHTRYITNQPAFADLAESDDFFSSLCPVAPRSQQLIEQLLDEVLELFDAPLVHVGLDEINIGHHPLTRAALQHSTRGELFAAHVLRLHRQIRAAGRRMMMWADQLLADPSIAAPDAPYPLPRDILLCNWQYAPDAAPDTTRQLLDWGFEVIACPALISHNQTLYPGESYAWPNIRALTDHRQLGAGVRGMLTTLWTPTRFLPDSLWPAIHCAAAIMNEGPGVAQRQALAQFAHTQYGLAPDEDWLRALLDLHQGAPRRDPWVAVLRLDPANLPTAAELSVQGERFERIWTTLQERRPQVQRGVDSYDSLLLMTEVLAHAWRRAQEWEAGDVGLSTLQQSERLSTRLSQAWDEHRHSDDPRKHHHELLHDSGDHLWIAFHEGTQALGEMLTSKSARLARAVGGSAR